MKLLLIGLVCLLVSCGKSNQSTPNATVASTKTPSNLIGVWTYTNGSETDTLTVEPYSAALSSYCNNSMSFTQPDVNGNLTITVTGSNGNPSCLSVGTHSCSMVTNDAQSQLTVNCGTAVIYSKTGPGFTGSF